MTYPNQKRAIGILNRAIAKGEICRQACEVCGHATKVVGHHDDYAEPLTVRWLCHWHHIVWHRENGPTRNRGPRFAHEAA